jgi:two-component system, OmpR family, sensor kinase
MRLSALLTLCFGFLLVCALASAGLTYWAVAKTRAWDERIGLAQMSYTEHQSLQANVYRLFKEHADALLIGNRDRSQLERAVETEIEGNIEAIRAIIAQEIKIEGEEEFEELGLLASIERQIELILGRYETILANKDFVAGVPTDELGELLDEDIDRDLGELIAIALAGERAEVQETAVEASDFRTFVSRVASGIMGLMLCVTVVMAILYRRYASRPLDALVRGADAYLSGDFSRPIPMEGTTELRQLAWTLSAMAEGIGRRERDLKEQAQKLELKVAERTSELQTILTQFEQAEESRRQMMADVSHELRTPLTIIQGEADVALRSEGGDPDQQNESFSRIRDAARHSNKIVDDLLLIAREEAGQLRLDLRNIDLDAALAESADMAQASVEVLRLGQTAQSRVDPVRLRQCLLAVMNNASRYGGTKIRAWIERNDDWHDVHVEDNGPGMSDAEKDQAFVRFFRGSGAQGTGVEGTGLGLPIVRSIMKAHGGSVDLSDRDGGGLVVRLRFPHAVRSVPAGKAAQKLKLA